MFISHELLGLEHSEYFIIMVPALKIKALCEVILSEMQQSDYLALSHSRTGSTFMPFGFEYHLLRIWLILP